MIWLARHGETTWNVAGRYQGRLESTLTPLGQQQATALAAYFVKRSERGEAVPQRIRSSPMLRCTATARPTADVLGLRVETDERLIEIGHGTWEGRYRKDIEREEPDLYRMWREEPARVAFDGGEKLSEVLERWRVFARELALTPEDTFLTTHDAVLRCALLDLLDRPLEDFWKMSVENGAFALLKIDGASLTVVSECEVEHLRQLRAAVTSQAL